MGVLITHVFEARNARREERQAWIQIVGTLKEWRGKGVAGALMAHALTVLARQGYHSAGLGVDVDNATGAVGVYTRAGFAITRRHTTYALPVVQGEARDEAGAGCTRVSPRAGARCPARSAARAPRRPRPWPAPRPAG